MLYDFPIETPVSQYHEALDVVVQALSATRGVRAVYQIGGVSAPGISDLDVVVVTEDGVPVTGNPLHVLPHGGRPLFVHSVFAAPMSLFERAQDYWFYQEYRLLWGESGLIRKPALEQNELAQVTVQVALEFVSKLYLTLVIQRAYGVLQVRGLLLLMYALRHDLELLGITSGPFRDHVASVAQMRTVWFEKHPVAELERTVNVLRDLLAELLKSDIARDGYFPGGVVSVGRNIAVRGGDRLSSRRSGILLPRALRRAGRRYVKLQNRLNYFEFGLPFRVTEVPDVVSARFDLIREMRQYNTRYLPHFASFNSGYAF